MIANAYHEGRMVQINDPESEHHRKKGVIVYSGGKGTHHTVHDKFGNSFGYHPSANLDDLETKKESIQEDSTPNIGSKVRAIRGQASGRIQTIAADSSGIKKAYVQTDDGRVIATPLDNVMVESKTLLSKVKTIIAESALLLEYNAEKTWQQHGADISKRMSAEGHPVEKHEELFHSTIENTDPSKNKQYAKWVASKYASGDIKRLEDIGTRVKPLLKTFHAAKQVKSALPSGVDSNIKTYKSVAELSDVVNKLHDHIGAKPSTNDVGDSKDTAMRHLSGENEHWQHFTLSDKQGDKATHKESRYLAHHYAGGTGGSTTPKKPGYCEWCTAQDGDESKDALNSYMKKGDIHVLIPKKPTHVGERYQIGHEENMQMDHNDDEIENIPKLFKDRPAPKSYTDVLHKHAAELTKGLA